MSDLVDDELDSADARDVEDQLGVALATQQEDEALAEREDGMFSEAELREQIASLREENGALKKRIAELEALQNGQSGHKP